MKVAIHRRRRRFRELVKAEIAQTLHDLPKWPMNWHIWCAPWLRTDDDRRPELPEPNKGGEKLANTAAHCNVIPFWVGA